jgi:hypothetical protein
LALIGEESPEPRSSFASESAFLKPARASLERDRQRQEQEIQQASAQPVVTQEAA